MAACCGVPRCSCSVVAGPGVTVDGNGSAAAPYTISATPVPTALQAGDTATVDNTLTGTGTVGDPYVLTSDVILDAAPPGGGTNLLQSGPDGLFVECAEVRTCFTAGDGIDYDPATGEIAAQLSTDAGNTVAFGTDGGLFVPPAAGTALQGGDTPTASNTITGTGTAGDPYVVSTDVVLDPAPPGGGANLLEAGPDGLYVECADVRTCFTAGAGITYDAATGTISAVGTGLTVADTETVDLTLTGTGAADDPYSVEADVIVAPEPNGLEAGPTGLLVAPSADAGNVLVMGGDGRLFVPPDAPLEVGCGLQGDGTAAAPLAAFPVAGSAEWSASWSCDPAAESTLRCDPTSGALWTPPEHYTAADHIYQEHMNPAIASIGPTGGWIFLQPGGVAAVVAFDVPANFLGNMCRQWSYSSAVHASVDLNVSATATFEIGYIYQEDGGALQVRPIEGVYTAFGAARRERYAGSVAETGFDKAAAGGLALHYFCAINVLTGTVGINSWTSDATIHTTTQA
ncbi:hypothetical protein ACH4Q7_22880 [Streptomyces roseolus]|uniref:hypothetical protein n=1 Tax=Streptomyces roseolus TaxID=67358 RepID=UPI0037A318D0